ncbi:MAG: hypothetical protein IPG64_21015 [Haliea sp.]|nr:hypothetical protein [Haliea sp.]
MLPGIIGGLRALEVVKLISSVSAEPLLAGSCLRRPAAEPRCRELRVDGKGSRCAVCSADGDAQSAARSEGFTARSVRVAMGDDEAAGAIPRHMTVEELAADHRPTRASRCSMCAT